MEIINYKGIIVIDDFITSEESDGLVSIIEKPKCYEKEYYSKYIVSGSIKDPLKLLKVNDKIYLQPTVLREKNINIIFNNVQKRIQRVLSSSRLSIDCSIIEKRTVATSYYADSEWPAPDCKVFMGEPAVSVNDHSQFINYSGDWAPNYVGLRLYSTHIFINDDFEGGNITFPQYNFDVAPKRNRLVCFPSDRNYIHATRLINGASFLLTTWFIKSR